MKFEFPQELIDRVKNNWLTAKHKSEFAECETGDELCLVFARVSKMNQEEEMLSDEIARIVVSKINSLRKLQQS